MSDVKRLHIVDGSGFIFRAFYAIPPMTRSDGVQVNAVFGFCSMLLKLLSRIGDDLIVVVFDAGRETFRHEIYPEYKANRGAPPEELLPQFELVREACDAFSVPHIELAGYEADDIIATYAHQAQRDERPVTIVSSDKDLMQLLGGSVALFDPMKDKEISLEDVEKKFGVAPDRVTDVQALCGDSSDNIPGVPGIGVKTAAALIQQFGDLEKLLTSTDQIPQKKRRALLEEHQEKARISMELVKLCKNVPLEQSYQDYKREKLDGVRLFRFFKEQNFRRLLSRVEDFGVSVQDTSQSSQKKEVAYTLITTEEVLDQWIARVRKKGLFAIDTETDSLNALQANLVGISLSTTPFEAAYIPLKHYAVTVTGLFPEKEVHENQLPLTLVVEKLKPLLSDPSLLKIGHNIKYDKHVLARVGLEMTPVEDTMVMSYVLDGSRHSHSLDSLSMIHLNHRTTTYKEVTGQGKQAISFPEVALEKACHYAAEDADMTLRLYMLLKKRLVEEKLFTIYHQLDRPLVETLTAMEAKGICLDRGFLEHLGQTLQEKLAHLSVEIYEQAGQEFNIASPKQLGEILFDVMGIAGGKKGKSGTYKTSVDVLEELSEQGHAIADKVIHWRGCAKLLSTYIQALPAQINPETGRVHTRFSQTVVSTGRLSSSDPNLQNIPIRTTEGREIRRAFVAAPGNILLSFDYSQIELRLLAHMADIKPLQEAFHRGEDIHRLTASQAMDIPLAAVTANDRAMAKTINFGIIYGISAFGLARQTQISRQHAAQYIERYFAQYPGIRQYMEEIKDKARKDGYVETLQGRKIFIPDILAKNPLLRNAAERQAINAPLQGTAADLIKKAMNTLHRELPSSKLTAQMLLQVHDELIFEAPASEEEALSAWVKPIMVSGLDLKVPLVIEVGVATNWAEAHG